MNETSLTAEYEAVHYDPQFEACRKLWAACLLHMTNDFISPSDKRREKRPLDYMVAKSWFGTFPDKDFSQVCMNAGFDPDEFHRRALLLHDAPEGEREDAAKRMIAKADA